MDYFFTLVIYVGCFSGIAWTPPIIVGAGHGWGITAYNNLRTVI